MTDLTRIVAADEVERAFANYDRRLALHTRRDVVHDDVVEDHLHWSSPLGRTTLDIYVTDEELRATWTGASNWMYLYHEDIDELKHAIETTPEWARTGSTPPTYLTNPTHITDIDSLTLGEVLSYLSLADVIRLLGTGTRRLLRNMRSTHIDRIDAVTQADLSCLVGSTSLRRAMPAVRVVHIHCLAVGVFSNNPDYSVFNLPRTIVSLHASHASFTDRVTKGIVEPFVHLQTLTIGTLRTHLPIEIFTPNLTSLTIHADGGLQCNSATALPSMLHQLSISITTWEGLIKINGDKEWPLLHTLTITQSSDTHASVYLLPNAIRCPSLTSLAFESVMFQADCSLDMMSGLRGLTHLAFTCAHSSAEIDSILHRTSQVFPPQLVSVTIDGAGNTAEYDICAHLVRLLPPSIQRITLHRTYLSSVSPSLGELLGFPNLSRICLDTDELCKVTIDGAAQWQTFSTLLLKADTVAPHVFECFELVRGDYRIPLHNVPVAKAVSVLLEKCPSVGVRMASRYIISCGGLCYFSFSALHQWLKYSTSADVDFTLISSWCYLLLAIKMHQSRGTSELCDVLAHHAKHTHPIMFRYLLHLTFLFAVRLGLETEHGTFDADAPNEILSHMSSQYGYNCTLKSPKSMPTLISLLQVVLDVDEYDVARWDQVIEMMERPYWADACCKGEIEDSPWFNQYPLWRATRIAADRLLEAYSNRSEYTVHMAVTSFDSHISNIKVFQRGEYKLCFRLFVSWEASGEISLAVVFTTPNSEVTMYTYCFTSLDQTMSRIAEAVRRAKQHL